MHAEALTSCVRSYRYELWLAFSLHPKKGANKQTDAKPTVTHSGNKPRANPTGAKCHPPDHRGGAAGRLIYAVKIRDNTQHANDSDRSNTNKEHDRTLKLGPSTVWGPMTIDLYAGFQ